LAFPGDEAGANRYDSGALGTNRRNPGKNVGTHSGRASAISDTACGEDSELRREVESLLTSHEGAGSKFLNIGAMEADENS